MRSHSSVTTMFAAMISIMIAEGGPHAWAADPPPQGHQLYRQYCGACHGPEARGDGVASSLMRPPPPDLTQLAAKHGGQFPKELVIKTIDGREMPRAHGDPAMPIWGQVLREHLEAGGAQEPGVEQRVQDRIAAITDYLRSIQAPAK